jgi:hypothetical protein
VKSAIEILAPLAFAALLEVYRQKKTKSNTPIRRVLVAVSVGLLGVSVFLAFTQPPGSHGNVTQFSSGNASPNVQGNSGSVTVNNSAAPPPEPKKKDGQSTKGK